ncbi:MAG TPA: hypothetical protein VKG25_12160 [Bryobacteraceae bacterium]|nr:hypothetical protein [Bryobacteraceae bacterium]
MYCSSPELLAEWDIRFLRYRLEVIREWPPSSRKDAMTEAISRRLTSIARSTYPVTSDRDLLGLSCHLLDDIFSR